MKLPYGYVLIGKEIVIHEEKADVVRSIFDDYLAGASLGKIVDLLFKKGVVSPTGKVNGRGRPWINFWRTKNISPWLVLSYTWILSLRKLDVAM